MSGSPVAGMLGSEYNESWSRKMDRKGRKESSHFIKQIYIATQRAGSLGAETLSINGD
jgi:hypothetical protein